jgi:hypothetical protein
VFAVCCLWWCCIQQQCISTSKNGIASVWVVDATTFMPASLLTTKYVAILDIERQPSKGTLQELWWSNFFPRRRIRIFSIRGGGSKPDEQIEVQKDCNDPLTMFNSDTTETSKPKRPRALSTPFYINEVARYEASVPKADAREGEHARSKPHPDAEPMDAPSTTSSDKTNELVHKKRKKKKKQKYDPSLSIQKSSENVKNKPVLAGGATIVIEPTKEDNEPLDEHNMVEPTMEYDSEDNVNEESGDKSDNVNTAASLWWGNVWTQQFEDDQDSLTGDGELKEDESMPDEAVLEEEVIEEQATIPGRIEAVVSERLHLGENVPNLSASDELPSQENVTLALENQDTFVSSGVWGPIDNLVTLGLASRYTSLRVSKQLRGIRKWTAHMTGLHGALSGKPSQTTSSTTFHQTVSIVLETPDESDLQGIQRRIAAIDRARKGVERARAVDDLAKNRSGLFGGLFRVRRQEIESAADNITTAEIKIEEPTGAQMPQKTPAEIEEERQRMERVKEIDRLIAEGQARLQDLICEKDVLQRRPNPLFDYKKVRSKKKKATSSGVTHPSSNESVTEPLVQERIEIQATRKMNFPPGDLVAEYLDMMISTRRLVKMNHTSLWKESERSDDDEEETIGDDLFTASADAHRLYQGSVRSQRNGNGNGNGSVGGGGSWLLRQSLVGGPSLGEKIGEAAETAAYKSVCAALMSFLARALSSLHGINVMKHSDIRLVLEQAPDLPLYGKDGLLPGSDSNYAEETIKTVMRRKSKRTSKRSQRPMDDSFVQRDAVTEMLLSHVQISAPLLKLFPLAWQRALLGNIITLATAVISDFLDGLRFQILGHELSFSFRPITEDDMILHFQLMSRRHLNHRKFKVVEFEAAVRATAEDVSDELKFLDRWHERALGSGVLRTQIANMIARIVLTLTDEILSAARMDLWSAQAGGPRILAGLEYRTETTDSL